MIFLRKSIEKNLYNPNTEYKSSFYNISDEENKYIFNSATGAIVSNPKCLGNFSAVPLDEFKLLVENGFLVPQGIDEFVEYSKKVCTGKKCFPNLFTIIPTTACNAKCFYCYEESYKKQTISADVIERIVNYISIQAKFVNNFTLDWYGGEPLLCVNIIDEIVSKLNANKVFENHIWTSSITTNATLFTEDLIQHAVDNWHLTIAYITIDGTEDEHNRRKRVSISREKSAYKLTWNAIYKLLQKGVYVNLRIHLDHNNAASINEILKDISPYFEFKNFHLFPTVLFPPEFETNESYVKDEEKEKLFFDVFHSMYDMNVISSYIDCFPKPKRKGCFATDPHSVIIAPDGTLHACVQEFSSHKDWDGDKKFTDFLNVDVNCRRCVFFPICLGGCVHNRHLKNTVRTACVRNRYIVKPLLKLLNLEFTL